MAVNLLVAITESTCGEACWSAAEDVCRCSCGGRNHGVLTTTDGEQPARTSKIDGYVYQLAAVTTYGGAHQETRRINEASPRRQRYGNMEFVYRHDDRGAPARFKAASKDQIARWPELTAYRDLPRYEQQPYLVWARQD